MAKEELQQLQTDLRDAYQTFFTDVEERVDGVDVVQEAEWRGESNDTTIKVEHAFLRIGKLTCGHELSMQREYDGGYGVTHLVMSYRTGKIIGVARGIDRSEATLTWYSGFPVPRVKRAIADDYNLAILEFRRGIACR